MNHAKDPLLGLSVLLGILGAVQSSTGFLSTLAQQYPLSFGLVMTGISALTAGLTIYRNAKTAQITAEAEATKLFHAARDHSGIDSVNDDNAIE